MPIGEEESSRMFALAGVRVPAADGPAARARPGTAPGRVGLVILSADGGRDPCDERAEREHRLWAVMAAVTLEAARDAVLADASRRPSTRRRARSRAELLIGDARAEAARVVARNARSRNGSRSRASANGSPRLGLEAHASCCTRSEPCSADARARRTPQRKRLVGEPAYERLIERLAAEPERLAPTGHGTP